VCFYPLFFRAHVAFAYATLAAAPKLRNLVRERELNTCQSHPHVVRARAVFYRTWSREARAHTAVLPHNRATCGGFWPLLEHQPQPHQLPSVTSVFLRALSRHAHTCMHIHAHTCMHTHALTCTYVHAHTCMHIHAHTCMHIQASRRF
jgi:hypothetical protein